MTRGEVDDHMNAPGRPGRNPLKSAAPERGIRRSIDETEAKSESSRPATIVARHRLAGVFAVALRPGPARRMSRRGLRHRVEAPVHHPSNRVSTRSFIRRRPNRMAFAARHSDTGPEPSAAVSTVWNSSFPATKRPAARAKGSGSPKSAAQPALGREWRARPALTARAR